MTALLQRLEAASADEQGHLISEAASYAREQGWIDHATCLKAISWVKVGAYLDAALTLVPEGTDWKLHRTSCNADVWFTAEIQDSNEDWWRARKSSPALALCIAALRARE